MCGVCIIMVPPYINVVCVYYVFVCEVCVLLVSGCAVSVCVIYVCNVNGGCVRYMVCMGVYSVKIIHEQVDLKNNTCHPNPDSLWKDRETVISCEHLCDVELQFPMFPRSRGFDERLGRFASWVAAR